MFFNQPLAHRFGTALRSDIGSKQWTSVELAAAWVRRSGMRHLKPAFREFLEWGGSAQVTVGVDIENTSAEGLTDLLALQDHGSIETYIHHNEASNNTFHPKVYLLRNDTEARLIVGSNNLTESGLFLNTEAGLQVDAALDDPLIAEARSALAAWRDPQAGLARRLDDTLLDDMMRLGYVFPEKELQGRRKASIATAKAKRPSAGEALFARHPYTAPRSAKGGIPPAKVPGTVLLMRVRRASETARRTQIQIPFRVVRTSFFVGIGELVSAHNGRAHPLILASARGGANTMKAEVPEIEAMDDPVMRLERTPTAIVYRVFDSGSVLGTPITRALLRGFEMVPPTSFTSVRRRDTATWWRFI